MNREHDPSNGARFPQEVEKTEKDALLDDALEDTFPASDPVAPISPGEPTAPRRENESDRPTSPDQSKTE